VNASGEIRTKAQRIANLKFWRDRARVDQRERKYYRAGVSEQRVGDEPRDDQREIWWSTTGGQYRSMHVWVKGSEGWQWSLIN